MGKAYDTKAVDGFTPQTSGSRFDKEFHSHVVPPYNPKETAPSYLVRNNRYPEKQAPAPKGGF